MSNGQQKPTLLDRIVPRYAYVPIFLVVLFNTMAYYLTKWIMQDAEHYDLSFFMDDMLPFVPFFVLFYVLAYLQWGAHYVFHSHVSREFCYHIVTADLMAKIVCMVFFIVLPTEIERPVIEGNGFWNALTGMIFSSDTPRNLFPSIHCLESWFCFRAALRIKRAPAWYAPAQLVLTVLVFASTVLIKQHFVVDIVGGIVIAELCWILTEKLKLWRALERIELPFARKQPGGEEENVS